MRKKREGGREGMRKKRERGSEGMRYVEQVSISSSPGQCSEMMAQLQVSWYELLCLLSSSL